MKILVVDDAPEVVESVRLGFMLQWREVDVLDVREGSAAVDLVEREAPDLVLLDIGLPDLDGIEVAGRLTTRDRSLAVVLTSSRDAGDYGPCLDRTPACGFVPKAELSGAGIADILPA